MEFIAESSLLTDVTIGFIISGKDFVSQRSEDFPTGPML